MGRRIDAAWLVLLSLLIRLPLWWWVCSHETAPLYDEAVYLELAEGWGRIFAGSEDAAAVDAALGDGRWPPLHPMVLGLVLRSGGGLAAARLAAVVLGASSTGLVYAFSRRLAGRRAAVAAAAVHALAPAFLFYSHSLWSETLTLFVALLALIAAVDCRRRLAAGWPFAGRAALAGLTLGALALTRVALLPWIVAVPAWIALTGGGPDRRRWLAAGLCLSSALAVLAPWPAVQNARFGSPGLSTLGGYNLALGNHAGVPARYGSSWGHRQSTLELQEELRRLASMSGRDWPAAASELALAEIKARPLAALRRMATRLWLLFAPDVLPVRHLLHGVYPALPPPVLGGAVLSTLAGHVLTISAGAFALLAARFRRRSAALPLLLALCASTALAPALSVAATRLHLPVELVLLPAIGAALAGRRRTVRRRWPAPLAALTVAVVSLATLPRVAELYWQPAAQRSAPLLGRALSPLGVETLYSDRYRLERASPGAEMGPGSVDPGAHLAVHVTGARLAPRPWLPAGSSARLDWPPRRQAVEFDVISGGLDGSSIELVDRAGRVLSRWQLADDRDTLARRRPVRRGEHLLTWLGGGVSPR